MFKKYAFSILLILALAAAVGFSPAMADDGVTGLVAVGAMTVGQAAAARQALLAAIEAFAQVRLDVGGVVAVDLTGLQLLCSAHATATIRGRSFGLASASAGSFDRAVTEAACRDCHAATVREIEAVRGDGEVISCIRCHFDVGHAK